MIATLTSIKLILLIIFFLWLQCKRNTGRPCVVVNNALLLLYVYINYSLHNYNPSCAVTGGSHQADVCCAGIHNHPVGPYGLIRQTYAVLVFIINNHPVCPYGLSDSTTREQSACTDGNTVFRCNSDKNSLVIIYMF